MSRTLADVVRSGALYCDEFYPGWAEFFRHDGPNIMSCTECVLGTLGMAQGLGVNEAFGTLHTKACEDIPFFLSDQGSNPFTHPARVYNDREYSWDEYNALWRQEVERRLKPLPTVLEEVVDTRELVTA